MLLLTGRGACGSLSKGRSKFASALPGLPEVITAVWKAISGVRAPVVRVTDWAQVIRGEGERTEKLSEARKQLEPQKPGNMS